MTHSKLDEILDEIPMANPGGELKAQEVAKIDIKLLMLNIYKEALQSKSVAEMSDKFRKLVEAL